MGVAAHWNFSFINVIYGPTVSTTTIGTVDLHHPAYRLRPYVHVTMQLRKFLLHENRLMDVMVVRVVMSHPGIRPQAVIHGGTWSPPGILGVCVDPVPGIVMCATYQRGYGGSVSWLGGSDGGLGSKVRCHLRSSHGGLDIGKALNPCALASTQFCSSPSRSISGSFSTLKLILHIPPISHGFLGHVKIRFHVSLGGYCVRGL
jgi:hypothetical protein